MENEEGVLLLRLFNLESQMSSLMSFPTHYFLVCLMIFLRMAGSGSDKTMKHVNHNAATHVGINYTRTGSLIPPKTSSLIKGAQNSPPVIAKTSDVHITFTQSGILVITLFNFGTFDSATSKRVMKAWIIKNDPHSQVVGLSMTTKTTYS